MSDWLRGDDLSRLGEIIHELSVTSGGRRDDDGGISAIVGCVGHVFYGPYVSVPPGAYSVRMIFSTSAACDSDSGLVLEAALSGEVIGSVRIDESAVESGMIAMQFLVPGRAEIKKSSAEPKLEIRVASDGKHEFTAASVDLRRLNSALRKRVSPSPA